MEQCKLRKLIREEIYKLNESKNPVQDKIKQWIIIHQEKYEKFIESLLLGKSINARASAFKGKGGDWKMYDINNIKKIQVNGGYFYEEVSVQDENGNWYVILSGGPLTIKEENTMMYKRTHPR